jgi:hypothetical protein
MKQLTLLLACGLLASCTTHAADTCLVGTWKAQGNGAAAWMARHMHGMHLHMGVRKATLRLKADGTYASGVRLQARATLADGGSAATHGPMSTSSKGHWHTHGRELILQPQTEQATGSIDFVTRAGRRARRPMPTGNANSMRMTYTCHGDAMDTYKQFPGIADPMTQHYVRVH